MHFGARAAEHRRDAGGDTKGALASYRKATALYESLGAKSSTDPAQRRELSMAYQRMSEILGSSGETGDALTFARQGLDLMREAAAMTSGDRGVPTDLRRELVVGHTRVGDLLSATGDTAGALEQRRLALAMMETVSAAAPEDPVNALGLLGRGDAYAAFATQGNATAHEDLAAAERDYLEGIEIMSALQKAGTIQGTDVTTLETARKELERIRKERDG